MDATVAAPTIVRGIVRRAQDGIIRAGREDKDESPDQQETERDREEMAEGLAYRIHETNRP